MSIGHLRTLTLNVEPCPWYRHARHVPGPERHTLTSSETQQLAHAEARIKAAEDKVVQARLAWAKLVRRLGVSAVARALDVTPQAVSERVKAAERRSAEQ